MLRLAVVSLLVACAGRPDPSAAASECTGLDRVGGHGGDSADAAAPTIPAAPEGVQVLTDVRLAGSAAVVSVRVEDGRVVAVGPSVDEAGATLTAGAGRVLVPGVIDSHVHLAYLPEADALARAGVVGAVDLAAPLTWLAEPPTALRVAASGPMITADDGYPTTSWGRDGYGVECADAEAATAAVEALVAAGAAVIKVPLSAGPDLPRPTLEAVAERAHALGVPLAIHALTDAGAALGAEIGGDVLVHVPTERLRATTVAAWADRTLVPTLTAFGDSATARDNLARLAAGGTRVLYGTDLGNSRVVGISAPELEAMAAAGLSPAAVLDAATRVPAEFWGWEDLGRVEVGATAAFVLLDADPTTDVTTWSRAPTRWPPLP